MAKEGDPKAARFPLPILKPEGTRACDVSYSGLKTAVINQLDHFWTPGYERTPVNIAASFQEAAVKILLRSLLRAVEITDLTTLVAGGGVAANSRLRTLLSQHTELRCIFPPLKLCTDNAAMIAGVAYHYLMRGDISPWDVGAKPRVEGFKKINHA
jgi:N6-L-threonylcarbamoyladenine synthase